MSEIGQNLRRIRMQAKLSQADLARLSFVDQTTISSLETGKNNPTMGTLTALAAALHVSVADLGPTFLGVADHPVGDAVKDIVDERWPHLDAATKIAILQLVHT